MTGAGADQQYIFLVAKLIFRPPQRPGFNWQVPTGFFNLDSQRPGKFKESLDLVLKWNLRYLLPDEYLVKVP